MKSIYFSIIILLLSINSFSQNITINNHLNKFIGTWRWSSGNDTVEIVLQKQAYDNSYEVLAGWHRYVKNGQLIQSSFQYIGRNVNIDANDPAGTEPKTTLIGSSRGANKLYFTMFWDLTRHKNFELYFTLLPNSTTQASWKLKYAGIALFGNNTLEIPGWTFPKNLILTKL